MPNYLGLMTKAEAKQLADLRLLSGYETIRTIANIIAQMQVNSPEFTDFKVNMVVTDDVDSYFKNTMQYTTDYVKQGYPNEQGLLRSISWA
jgi:hypothetical protein